MGHCHLKGYHIKISHMRGVVKWEVVTWEVVTWEVVTWEVVTWNDHSRKDVRSTIVHEQVNGLLVKHFDCISSEIIKKTVCLS